MRIRETVFGLIVLGLVLTGVFWARGRGHSGGTMTGDAAGTTTRPVGDSAAIHPAEGGAAADAAMPDITRADGSADLGDVRVTLSVAPRPPVAFEKKHFRVRVETNGAPVVLDGGRISFEMKMPMGDHRYTLIAARDGWQEAEVVLPFCPSGNPRWYATVEGTVSGRPIAARFLFDLTRQGSVPTP